VNFPTPQPPDGLRCEAHHSPPYTFEVKNGGVVPPLPHTFALIEILESKGNGAIARNVLIVLFFIQHTGNVNRFGLRRRVAW
jgi:hypothetical protein